MLYARIAKMMGLWITDDNWALLKSSLRLEKRRTLSYQTDLSLYFIISSNTIIFFNDHRYGERVM